MNNKNKKAKAREPIIEARKLIRENKVKKFSELFNIINPGSIASLADISADRFKNCVENVERFRLEDAFTLAEVFNTTNLKMLRLLSKDYEEKEKSQSQ